ncbi:MAG: hypothetical protein PWQ35_24 [Patescibacteria group bacterium]|nr:hypothetical protein [Patescibacteria group bacterium]
MKKIIFKSRFLITLIPLLALFILFSAVLPVEAQIENFEFQVQIPGMDKEVPVGQRVNGRIQSTLLGDYIKNIYNYSFLIAGILAAVMLMVGGVMWLISAGNKTSISKAKDIISGSIVGLGILLLSYLILNTINPELLKIKAISIEGMDDYKANNLYQIGCCECDFSREVVLLKDTETFTCQSSVNITSTEDCAKFCKYEAEAKLKNLGFSLTTYNLNWEYRFASENACLPMDNGKGSRCVYSVDYLKYKDTFNYVGWHFDEGIIEQLGDVSPELAQLLNCMRDNLPPGVGIISSISDSGQIGTGYNCVNDNFIDANCVHSRNSCHYGDKTNSYKSRAVDLGDEGNYKYFEAALGKCDSAAKILHEGNHIHISTNDCPNL